MYRSQLPVANMKNENQQAAKVRGEEKEREKKRRETISRQLNGAPSGYEHCLSLSNTAFVTTE